MCKAEKGKKPLEVQTSLDLLWTTYFNNSKVLTFSDLPMLNQKEDEEHEEMDGKGIQDWHINTDDP